MENSQHVKSISTDPRSKNRLRYKSSSQRAKTASADVYRSYKRRIGVTSAASREERVHHPHREGTETGLCKRRHIEKRKDGGGDKVAILSGVEEVGTAADDESDVDFESTFASELDLALDRNASEIFGRFYREVWHLARSLPEVLHHATEIVDLLVSYLLSPESDPTIKSPSVSKVQTLGEERETFVLNHATTDILHLLAVFARDLRHEIHPFIHSLIIPRIVYDLLNPPLPPRDSGKQPLPLDVTVVEAAFRTLSYVFRYDAEPILAEVDKKGQEPCLERLRQYYGAALGHRRQYVRRLAAETIAPMIRKLKLEEPRRRHLRRVLRALAASVSAVKLDGRPLMDCLTRLQRDAIDGIAFLFFETAHGVNGKLHSRGNLIVRCLFEYVSAPDDSSRKNPNLNRVDMIQLVASSFVDKLARFLEKSGAEAVVKELQRVSRRVLSTAATLLEKPDAAAKFAVHETPLASTLKLWDHCIQHNVIIVDNRDAMNCLSEVLDQLLESQTYNRLTESLQSLLLKVLASAWKSLFDHASLTSRLGNALLSLFRLSTDELALSRAADFLAIELLPHLPPDIGIKYVGTAVLSAAARRANQDRGGSLVLILSVVSTRTTEDESPDEDDDIFFLEGANHCEISAVEQERLIDLCLQDPTNCFSDSQGIADIAASARCLPFLAVAGDSKRRKVNYQKRIEEWALALMTAFDVWTKKQSAESSSFEFVFASALALESVSVLIAKDDASSLSVTDLSRLRPFVEKMLLTYPQSIWVVKAVASYTAATRGSGRQFSDQVDEVFDSLAPNLRKQNHFLRLHTLEILVSLPKRPFVTDHADIDWTDDLDEETSSTPEKATAVDVHSSSKPSGLCNILETLLQLESTPVSLDNERRIVSCITSVEIQARTGRLPVAYAEAASNHMIGILHIKFSPIWDAAVRALKVLTLANEGCAWPSLVAALRNCMQPTLKHTLVDTGLQAETRFMSCSDHLMTCVSWDESGGSNSTLFSDRIRTVEAEGRISRHCCTDSLTTCQYVWRVLENTPELAAKKSRHIVPMFLDFLHSQYFFFNGNEADARELSLEAEIDSSTSWPREALQRNEMQMRLLCFLRTFAAVNGPRQLYKHQLLLSIFKSFLSHHETDVAQTALSCVLKYKLPYLVPYANHLEAMLRKNELRDALLRFDVSKTNCIIDADHRNLLINVITRILFGRLSSRVAVGKSSKDTPSTRRATVLSFFSVIAEDESELYPLFYLMVRSYIPNGHCLKPLELHGNRDRDNIESVIRSVQLESILHLPIQRHEGFLNLLSAVLSQLGMGVKKYVPSFMGILVALCKYSEARGSMHNDFSLSSTARHDPNSHEISAFNRMGDIRTLCFRRLAECFNHFADSVDFIPLSRDLWAAISRSIEILPRAAATAEKVPALMLMLETISSHSSLIPLLQMHDVAVRAVVESITPATQQPVMDSSLRFLDNLLTNGGIMMDEDTRADGFEEHGGIDLAKKHAPLLLTHFSQRLASRSSSGMGIFGRNFSTGSSTKCNELTVLCRLSRILLKGSTNVAGLNDCAVLETLCELLVGFLGRSSKASEADLLQLIEILSALIPRLDEESALSHLPALSQLLGPVKALAGNPSLSTRNSIALLIRSMCTCSGVAHQLQGIADVTVQLCSSHSKRVDEMDYDMVLSALNSLADESSVYGWRQLCADGRPALLLPVVQICFFLLYSDDGVVNRGAFMALKSLVASAAVHEERPSSIAMQDDQEQSAWAKFIETVFVPIVRSGIGGRSQANRRMHILLLAEVSRNFNGNSSPNLYGDLGSLIRDDEPELDFFLNITHVQIHRRCRAIQRLRRTLDSEPRSQFHLQSLSNVLLPIALHPIYESKTKLEEPFALEAISLIGEIAKRLSWSKYHNTLWTALVQLERHPEQERYLIGTICAMLDSFHFDLVESAPASGNGSHNATSHRSNTAVWRALENRIVPKVENLLTKEKLGRDGEKTKILRPHVVLALLKLSQKFPKSVFESKLPRLLAIMCDTLKSKDSDARDAARLTLAKMTVSMNLEYMHEVINHLATSLTEGYQLHVRMATVHTILLHLLELPMDAIATPSEYTMSHPFDRCIPVMMDLIQADLFGTARERKVVEGARKRFVKEAFGSKSNDAVELISRLLYFKPSHAAITGSVSSIHSVIMPLLNRLQSPDTSSGMIGRIRECLNRVVVGLSRNPSVTIDEVFPFIYASISPFIIESHIAGPDECASSSEEELDGQIAVSSSEKTTGSRTKSTRSRHSKSSKVVEWRPSALNTSKSSRDARNTKNSDQRQLRLVKDGASAPKLTGSSRYGPSSDLASPSLNSPSSVCAVLFGLGLLHSILKKAKLPYGVRSTDEVLDPFIPLLTTCVCACTDNDVILLSIRCLGFLLRMNLPSVEYSSRAIGAKILDMLTSAGSLANLHQELTQACFKALTLLISRNSTPQNIGREKSSAIVASEDPASVPLNSSQMQALISLLKGAVVESDHHNPTFGLIKAIASQRYISTEFYDLMETCLELSVRSQKTAVRQLSANIFMRYLLDYPMGKQRLEDHLKQIVSNTKYEYEEGKLSAVGLATTAIEKLPIALLEEHSRLFFLPMVLQLVNDESKACREAVAKLISRLLTRVSIDTVQSFYNYIVRWSGGEIHLQRTALQLFGIVVDARPDFVKRSGITPVLIERLCDFLGRLDTDDTWEIPYFSLLCLEKMKDRDLDFVSNDRCFSMAVESLVHPHPWVKRSASRLVAAELALMELESFAKDSNNPFVKRPGALYKLACNVCTILDLDEPEQDTDLSTCAIKALTWIVQAMDQAPTLCFAVETSADQNPVKWLMTRLSQIAKPKGTERRKGMFKCFAAFATFGGADLVVPYLELIMEPLHRSIVEAENISSVSKAFARNQPVEESEEATLARDTLQVLEDSCSEQSDTFLKAYAAVKIKARDKKEQRKQHAASEAIRDPRAAAVRKMKKQHQEKKRRKRRSDEHRQQHGRQAKRRHHF